MHRGLAKVEIPIISSVQKIRFRDEIGIFRSSDHDARPFVLANLRNQISSGFATGTMLIQARGRARLHFPCENIQKERATLFM